MLKYFIENYGYWAVLVGTFLEGETILALGGFAAHEGYLHLQAVWLVALIGSFSGDQLWFFVGRRFGHRILAKRPRWQARAVRINLILARHHTWFIATFRFMYGLRTVAPFALGMSDVSTKRYVALNFLGAVVWAISLGTAGFLFGQAMELFLHRAKHFQLIGLATIAVAGVLIWLFFRIKKPARLDKNGLAQ